MVLKNLSLATIIALGSYANAADTLAGMFSEGKLKGEIKSYYFDRDVGSKDGSINTIGLKLDYETGSLYGFKLGAGIQTSNSPWIDNAGKTAFGGDMYGDGAIMSQAYLAYTAAKTTFKIGRQYIKSPMVKGSGSRLIVQSFEGATAVSKDLPNTALYAAYVTKFQNRVETGTGDIAEFKELTANGDDAYAVALVNTSLPGTTLTAGYGELENSHSLMYLEANYKNKLDSFSYNIAAQYSNTDYDNNATSDANYYGLKLGLNFGALNTYIAYAEVNDGTAQYKVIGDGTKPTIFTTTIQDSGQYNESTQYAVDANYNFKDINTKIGARYVNIDYQSNLQADWKMLYGTYKFNGALKGLTANVVYENKDHDTNTLDKDELWIKLSYKF